MKPFTMLAAIIVLTLFNTEIGIFIAAQLFNWSETTTVMLSLLAGAGALRLYLLLVKYRKLLEDY